MSRTALIVSLLVGLLLTAAWWFLLVGPQRTREAEAADALEVARDEEFLLQTQLAQLKRIQDNELPYRAAIAELQRSIPDNPQTASLIDELSALAEETGVVWSSGTYGNPEANEDTELFEIPLAISIEGQYFEVLGYLFGIADLERLVRIDAVTISPSQDENNFTILSVNLTGRAFSTATVLVPFTETEGGEPAPGETPAPGAEDSATSTTTSGGGDGDVTTTTTATDTSTVTPTDSSTPAGGARAGSHL